MDGIFGMLHVFGEELHCVQNTFCSCFWVYGIYNVPWLDQFTIRISHVVPRKIYPLAYYVSLLLFLEGLLVCGCSLIPHISVHSLIGVGVVLIYVSC